MIKLNWAKKKRETNGKIGSTNQHGMLADFSVAQRNRPHRWFPQSAYSLTEPGTSSFPFTLTGMNSIETANKIDNKYKNITLKWKHVNLF